MREPMRHFFVALQELFFLVVFLGDEFGRQRACTHLVVGKLRGFGAQSLADSVGALVVARLFIGDEGGVCGGQVVMVIHGILLSGCSEDDNNEWIGYIIRNMPATSAVKTLIVAAYAMELKPMADLGRQQFLICGNTAYLSAGIGPVAAAFGLTHFLESHRPERIIAVGTAGVIDTGHFTVGQVVRATSVATASGFFQVYTPEAQPQRILLSVGRQPVRRRPPLTSPRHRTNRREPSRLPLFGRLPAASVFAPQEITRADGFREALLRQGYGVEHLESFAFAFTARKFRVPIDLVLGLTNGCGPGAHREWKTNALAVMEKVGKIVAGALHKGSQPSATRMGDP